MSDPLREILRSPLDDVPELRISVQAAVVLVAALTVGIVTGWVVGSPAETATTPNPTTTVPGNPLDLPVGWADTGLGYAVGVTWMYTRGSDLVVGVAVSTRAGQEPADVGATPLGPRRRGIGLWSVELSGGQTIEHTREMFDPAAAGSVTVEFADLGATVDDVRSIHLRPASGYGLRQQNLSIPLDGLPVRIGPLEPLTLTERVEQTSDATTRTDLTYVTIDELAVDWNSAAMWWSLNDHPDVRAIVQPAITIDGDTDDPIGLATDAGGGGFLQRSLLPLAPAASGTSVLRKTSRVTGGSYTPARASVTLTLSWLRYTDYEIELDLAGATRLVAVE